WTPALLGRWPEGSPMSASSLHEQPGELGQLLDIAVHFEAMFEHGRHRIELTGRYAREGGQRHAKGKGRFFGSAGRGFGLAIRDAQEPAADVCATLQLILNLGRKALGALRMERPLHALEDETLSGTEAHQAVELPVVAAAHDAGEQVIMPVRARLRALRSRRLGRFAGGGDDVAGRRLTGWGAPLQSLGACFG